MKQAITLYTWLLFFVLNISPSNALAALVNFSIGNSLTNQLHIAYRMESLSYNVDGSNYLASNHHILCNMPLTTIVAKPRETCIPAINYGYYGDAFASTKFDTVTLQPFINATIRQEVDSAVQIVNQLRQNPANANTRVLIYGTWGVNTDSSPFVDSWKTQDMTLDSPFVQSKKGYELFMQEFLLSVPNAEFIPAGHVFNAIAERMKTPDQIPGLDDITDLYGVNDRIHASDTGALVASLNAYSAIYGKSTIGYEYRSEFTPFVQSDTMRLSPAALRQIQQLSWETKNSLSFSPRSLNRASSDPQSLNFSVTTVPEPNAAILVGLGICSLVTSFRVRSKRHGRNAKPLEI